MAIAASTTATSASSPASAQGRRRRRRDARHDDAADDAQQQHRDEERQPRAPRGEGPAAVGGRLVRDHAPWRATRGAVGDAAASTSAGHQRRVVARHRRHGARVLGGDEARRQQRGDCVEHVFHALTRYCARLGVNDVGRPRRRRLCIEHACSVGQRRRKGAAGVRRHRARRVGVHVVRDHGHDGPRQQLLAAQRPPVALDRVEGRAARTVIHQPDDARIVERHRQVPRPRVRAQAKVPRVPHLQVKVAAGAEVLVGQRGEGDVDGVDGAAARERHAADLRCQQRRLADARVPAQHRLVPRHAGQRPHHGLRRQRTRVPGHPPLPQLLVRCHCAALRRRLQSPPPRAIDGGRREVTTSEGVPVPVAEARANSRAHAAQHADVVGRQRLDDGSKGGAGEVGERERQRN
mmetsp:Transcript_1111/g.3541  ORF Transcript_1111/g.3541 Transcript_1111/m.3541 type:complete len:407 (-) Transcript_1111:154-1374(-)